jgi:hypothetical protein
MRLKPTFTLMHATLSEDLREYAALVEAPNWQGVDVSKKPEMATYELLNQSFSIPLRGVESLQYWAQDTKANQFWADAHFLERVSGEPLNPPPSYKIWPWGHSAEKFLNTEGKFDHTYPERFWPKKAGITRGGFLSTADSDYNINRIPVRRGIRFEYGDLNDLVQHLLDDPLSRQAYLPVWFPEDGTCKGRRPCTLGYHFINRFDYLHVTYYIRSCDFVRHWRDDCYLTLRLLFWILDRLRERDDRWKRVLPGLFTFHCVSLHMFRSDYEKLYGPKKAAQTAAPVSSGRNP